LPRPWSARKPAPNQSAHARPADPS
jgi:hypothetical protein